MEWRLSQKCLVGSLLNLEFNDAIRTAIYAIEEIGGDRRCTFGEQRQRKFL